MKLALASCLLVITSTLGAAEFSPASQLFSGGVFSLNARLRSENVTQTGLAEAQALTLRTRLGFTSVPHQGWQAMLEAENITAAKSNSYSQAGLNFGGAGQAVIADPETTEINQAWVAATGPHTTATLGRQRLILDNARFIGDVGWRQNMQTFDGVVVTNHSLAQTILTYGYFDQINRVFSDRHTQGKWRSASSIGNLSYRGFTAGTLTGYAYLLNLKNLAAANSCATYGVSFAGSSPLTATLKLAYRAELAQQSDAGTSPLNYQANYYNSEIGLVAAAGSITLGHEVLGSDHNVGFKTPLATLHAFNGWADLFLTTPAAGLHDTSLKATTTLPGQLALIAWWHHFETATGSAALGEEFDAQASRKFSPAMTGLIKFAQFRPTGTLWPAVKKIWLQVEYVY